MKSPTRWQTGFSLVEILVIIAVLGIMAGVTIPVITGAPEAAKKEKLEQDVVLVNNAIDAYLASGGDPAKLTASDVLAALKSRVTGGTAAEMMGPQGPFLDPTVTTNATDFAWSAVLTTGARPRFVVVEGSRGVVFGTGPAMAIGGEMARSDEARPSWLWTYADATPPPDTESFTPVAVDSDAPARVVIVGETLDPPVISPQSLTTNLWGFPLEVTIQNPNQRGSSRIYYRSVPGGFVLYDGLPFTVDPGTELQAVCVSLDPTRFYNSEAAEADYGVVPLQLAVRVDGPAAVTYAEAGGVLIGIDQRQPAQALIKLEDVLNTVSGQPDSLIVNEDGPDKYIPAQYRRSEYFVIRYTTDGTDPETSATAQLGPSFAGVYSAVPVSLATNVWGGNSSVTIRAAAIPSGAVDWFTKSGIDTNTVVINRTPIQSPQISPAAGGYFGSFQVGISNISTGAPAGTAGYYTTDGSVPDVANGQYFAPSVSFRVGPLAHRQTNLIRAVSVAPADLSHWFIPSAVSEAAFTGPNFNYAAITGGVLISGGTVGNNAVLRGSIVISGGAGTTPGRIRFDNNTGLSGDVFAPGTPDVSGVAPGQIQDLDGDPNPTGYSLSFGSGVVFTNTVFRRATPVQMPAVSLPSDLTSRGSASGGALLPGRYTSVTVRNNGKITLGGSGDSQAPAVYRFDSLTLGNGAAVEVVGPVVLYLTRDTTIANNNVVGNRNRPEWLQLRMPSGNLELGNNGYLYGTVLAPASMVTFQNNSTFVGGVTARIFNMNNNSGGISFSLPPPE